MQIAIALYPHHTALDAIGPYQVFSYLPGAEVVVCAAAPGPLVDDRRGLTLEITHAFGDIEAPDVVIVPGGLIARALARRGDPIIDWIRDVHERTRFTTSVCTGALLLGAAGLLRGRRATTHWSSYDELRAYGAEPTAERVVDEGRILTAAGVSAGIDLALTLVGRLAGPEAAQAIQLGLEYDPQPPYDAGSPAKVSPELRELVRAVLTDGEDQYLGGTPA
jgi:transcriptional regulator GlxA family with amidase domain